MDQVKLKVCGMREGNNIREVGGLRPDYMGFIFYSKSPRYVGEDFELTEDGLSGVKKVGVFVNEQTSVVVKKVKRYKLDLVQLHGDESVEQCTEVKENNVKVIKAFGVHEGMNFADTKAYEKVCDFFLFDTKGKYYGGNSVQFDWTFLQRYSQSIPFFLSGGIGVDSMDGLNSLKDMNLHAIDINSGVEVQPALKDLSKIKAIQNILTSK